MRFSLLTVFFIFSFFQECMGGLTEFKTETVTQCGSRTCLHNAVCNSDGISCQCRRGYHGDLCEHDTDECARSTTPCGHRGHCHNIPGSWRCDCLQGWKSRDPTQEHCELKLNPDINFRKCLPGWMGDMCADECFTDSDCGPDQFCQKHGRGKQCFCNDPAWQGRDCTTDIDECLKHPCKNFQVCINTPGSYQCACPNGWQGANCSVDVDECTKSPCVNAIGCVNTAGSYTCNCKTGWQGANCSVDVDECTKSPCVNAIGCVNTAGSYTCNCKSGWQGPSCDEDVDECLAKPCNSSSTCHNSLGSYSCVEKPSVERVDPDALKNGFILVMSIGALLLLLIIIFIIMVIKSKSNQTQEKNWRQRDRKSPMSRPYDRAGDFKTSNKKISPTPHTGSRLYGTGQGHDYGGGIESINARMFEEGRLSDRSVRHHGIASFHADHSLAGI